MLKIVLILSAVAACALGAAIPEGMVPLLDGRIVGGQDTTIEAFPWQVSIQRNGQHVCGGAIIGSYKIVTSAHCLVGAVANEVRVRTGSSNWNSGGTLASVSSFKIHEKYSPTTMANDVAVISTSNYLYTGSTIKYISLATSSPSSNAAAVVSGWGSTYYGSPVHPYVLKSIDLKIVTQSTCSSTSYGYSSLVKTGMLCAQGINKDTCQGDSGSPLVAGSYLVGIASWGQGCGNPNFPGVYTDVAAVRTWIQNA